MNKMEKPYYMLYLDEPAKPSFCSFAKQYFGTLDNIATVMNGMEATGALIPTTNAWHEYLEGNQRVTHNIAYQNVPLLTPVECVLISELSLRRKQWVHENVWCCTYEMRFDEAQVAQNIFRHESTLFRCIRTKMKNLCYKDMTGKWIPVDSFWGNQEVMQIERHPYDAVYISNNLYVIEDKSDDFSALETALRNPDWLIFDKICDEIFADG